MKKKCLSGLVILITIILATYMIINNKKNSADEYIMVENSKDEKISQNNVENFLNEIEKNMDSSEAEKTEKKESFVANDLEEIEEIEEIENEENKEEKEDEKKVQQNIKKEKEYISKEESVSVFKVDKTMIVENLSFREKKDLTKIITSLSMNDYALIIESIKNDGELECVIKVNSILEQRLDEDQYELIKNILEPYINLEIL